MMVSGIAAAGSWLQESCFQDLSFQELGFQTLTAALGSLAFGIVYKVRNERLPVVAAGGGIGWCLYSVIFCRWESIFISNMAASVFATLYSEAMARKRKAPVVVFLLPCLIQMCIRDRSRSWRRSMGSMWWPMKCIIRVRRIFPCT